MKIKKIIILSIVALMLVGCISNVSAGWLDFLKQETELSINSTLDGLVYVDLKSSNKSLENKTIIVNINENGENKNYTINSSNKQVLACTLNIGVYNVTAKFEGDDQYQASNTTKTVEVTKLSRSVNRTINHYINSKSRK